jgi:hypothetical protein
MIAMRMTNSLQENIPSDSESSIIVVDILLSIEQVQYTTLFLAWSPRGQHRISEQGCSVVRCLLNENCRSTLSPSIKLCSNANLVTCHHFLFVLSISRKFRVTDYLPFTSHDILR